MFVQNTMYAVSVLTKFLRTKEGEVGQRKGCTFKALLPLAGKSARKLDKRLFVLDISGR